MLSDGPGVYANNVECVWLVDAPGPIRVVFAHFHTEAGSDFLKIYDGTGDDAALLLTGDDEASFSGAALPESFTTNSTSLAIVFTSGGSISFSGFELELFALEPGGTWAPTGGPTAPPTWASQSGTTHGQGAVYTNTRAPHVRQCGSIVSASTSCAISSVSVAAAPDGVVFQCDPAADGCAPDGTVAWRCSSDCIDEECEMSLAAHGLRGLVPELGDVRCAQRIAQMCVLCAAVVAPSTSLPELAPCRCFECLRLSDSLVTTQASAERCPPASRNSGS